MDTSKKNELFYNIHKIKYIRDLEHDVVEMVETGYFVSAKGKGYRQGFDLGLYYSNVTHKLLPSPPEEKGSMDKRELVEKTTFSNSILEICSLIDNAFNRLEQLNNYRIQTEEEKRVLSNSRRQLMKLREQLVKIALKYTEEVEKEVAK